MPPIRQAVSLVGATLFVVYVVGCGGEPPRTVQPPYLNKFLVKASPGGAYEATFYNYGKGGSGFLGATVSAPMYVNVRRRAKPFDPEQGQVFAMNHGYRLLLVWQDERHLRIDYTLSAGVSLKRSQFDTVSVVSRPVPQNQLPEPYKALP